MFSVQELLLTSLLQFSQIVSHDLHSVHGVTYWAPSPPSCILKFSWKADTGESPLGQCGCSGQGSLQAVDNSAWVQGLSAGHLHGAPCTAGWGPGSARHAQLRSSSARWTVQSSPRPARRLSNLPGVRSSVIEDPPGLIFLPNPRGSSFSLCLCP